MPTFDNDLKNVPTSQIIRRIKGRNKQILAVEQYYEERLSELRKEKLSHEITVGTVCGFYCLRCKAQLPYSGSGKHRKYCDVCRRTIKQQYKHEWDTTHREHKTQYMQHFRESQKGKQKKRQLSWKEENTTPEVTKCPQCGATKIVTDYDSGEVTCQSCGFVIPKEGS